MDIHYPIFIKDKDGWMRMLNSKEEFHDLEEIDIENREYTAWDARGLPLELYMDNDRIEIKTLSDFLELNKLKEAILNYAKIGRPKVQFVYLGQQDNMIELFNAAEKHIESGRFIYKIKHLFKKT